MALFIVFWVKLLLKMANWLEVNPSESVGEGRARDNDQQAVQARKGSEENSEHPPSSGLGGGEGGFAFRAVRYGIATRTSATTGEMFRVAQRSPHLSADKKDGNGDCHQHENLLHFSSKGEVARGNFSKKPIN
jgi:hypothetical protein